MFGSNTVTLKAVLVGSDRSLGRTLSGTATKALSFGKVAGAAVGGVAIAAAGLGIAAVNMAADFESSMSKIEGLVGISRQQVNAWSTEVLELAKTLPQSPKELADALFFVTSAGFRGAEAMDVLTTSARAAAAGLGETQVIADALTSVINAYGAENINAAEAADILTSTVREGKAEASSIAPVLGALLPLTSELEVGFADVGAAIAAMTRTGNSAEESSTQIRAILTGLLKPAKQGAEALEEVGLSYKGIREQIATKGLFPALMDVRTAFKGNNEELAKVIPNTRALRGFLSLTGKQAKNNAEIFDSLADSTGATDKAFKTASETADFKFKSALSSLQVVGIEIGNELLPVVKDLADWVSEVAAPAISKFVEEFRNGTGAGGEFREALEDLWDAAKEVWEVISENKEELKLLAKVIFGVVLLSLKQMATATRILTDAWVLYRDSMTAIYNGVIGPIFDKIMGGIAAQARAWARMLDALSHVPGFGWAKAAADKMRNAANQADAIGDRVREIPTYKSVTVSVTETFTQLGRSAVYNQAGYRQGYTNVPRAGGGPVQAGMSYLVGENGPELLTPDVSGMITPARQTAQALRRSGGGGSAGGGERVVVQLVLDGKVIQQSLLKRQRESGPLGLVPA